MLDFTFLNLEQIIELEILKKYGSVCGVTDFAILLGSDASPGYFNGGKDRTCYWWTRTTDYPNKAYIVDFSGNSFRVMGSNRSIGARPVVTYS